MGFPLFVLFLHIARSSTLYESKNRKFIDFSTECLKNSCIAFAEKDKFFTKIIRLINDKSNLNDTEIGAK